MNIRIIYILCSEWLSEVWNPWTHEHPQMLSLGWNIAIPRLNNTFLMSWVGIGVITSSGSSGGYPTSVVYHWWAHETSRGLNSNIWHPRCAPLYVYPWYCSFHCPAGILSLQPNPVVASLGSFWQLPDGWWEGLALDPSPPQESLS